MNRLPNLLLAVILLSFANGYSAAHADEPMVALPRSHPAKFDFRNRPPVPANMRSGRVIVFFAIKHKAEFQELIRQIEDPNSPQYRHGLSNEEMHRRFGQTRAEFDAVEQWLKSRGFDSPQHRTEAASFSWSWMTKMIGTQAPSLAVLKSSSLRYKPLG